MLLCVQVQERRSCVFAYRFWFTVKDDTDFTQNDMGFYTKRESRLHRRRFGKFRIRCGGRRDGTFWKPSECQDGTVWIATTFGWLPCWLNLKNRKFLVLVSVVTAEGNCSACLRRRPNTVLNTCGHVFCLRCIRRIGVMGRRICPVCREHFHHLADESTSATKSTNAATAKSGSKRRSGCGKHAAGTRTGSSSRTSNQNHQSIKSKKIAFVSIKNFKNQECRRIKKPFRRITIASTCPSCCPTTATSRLIKL